MAANRTYTVITSLPDINNNHKAAIGDILVFNGIQYTVLTIGTGTTTYNVISGIIIKTKAEINALILASALVAGATYQITGVHPTLYDDSTSSGTTIFLQALTSNKLSVSGHGLFYNPKYNQAVLGFGIWSDIMFGTFTNVVGNFDVTNQELINGANGEQAYILANGMLRFTSGSGDWSTTPNINGDFTGATADVSGFVAPTYAIGDKVIWGGYSWTNVNGNVGASIDILTLDVEWTKDVYDLTNYNLALDIIEYDYENDWISRRYEVNSNIDVTFSKVASEFFTSEFGLTYSAISVAMFGNPYDYNVTGTGVKNIIVNDGYNENINFRGKDQRNLTFEQYSNQYDLIFGQDSRQYDLSFGKNAYQVALILGQQCVQQNITFKQNSNQGILVFGNSSAQNNLTFGQGSHQYNLTFTESGNQNNLTFGNNSNQHDILFGVNASQNDIIFETGSHQENLIFGLDAYQSFITFGQASRQYNLTFGANASQDGLVFESLAKQNDIIFGLDSHQSNILFEISARQENLNLGDSVNIQNITFKENINIDWGGLVIPAGLSWLNTIYSKNEIIYNNQKSLANTANNGSTGLLLLPFLAIPIGYFFDELYIDATTLPVSSAILILGIDTIDSEIILNSADGLVNTLIAEGITRIIPTTFQKTTVIDTLVAYVGGDDIVSGTLGLIIKFKKFN